MHITAKWSYYITVLVIGSKSLSCKYSIRQKNGLHAFDYNSGESEPMMKSGSVTKCWGLTPADFGSDPHSRNSLRGIRNFLVTWITDNFTDFPSDKFYIWTQQRQSVSPCKLPEQNFKNFYHKGSFFQKKTQKLFTKFPGLATSGRHNSAMITDRRKFTVKLAIYWISTKVDTQAQKNFGVYGNPTDPSFLPRQ